MKQVKVIDKNKVLHKKKKVAAYARVSSDKDAMHNSLSAQVSFYNKFIQQNDEWEFAGVFSDEAKTGTKEDRPGFQALLQACREKKVDLVIVKSLSRFARNTVTVLKSVKELKELGINIYFEEERLYSNSGECEMILNIMASYYQEEARSVSENMKWRIKRDFEQGLLWGGRDYFGYKVVDRKLVVVPEQAKVVKHIFELYEQGYGDTMIAKILNKEGIKPLHNEIWTRNSVVFILRNETYTGNLVLQKTYHENYLTKKSVKNKGEKDMYYVEDSHEPIIDKETFQRCMALRAERAAKVAPGKASSTYPFTGMLICANCGKHYRHKVGAYRDSWVCNTSDRYGKEYCSSSGIPERALYKTCLNVLGLCEFNETIFKKKVKEIRVLKDRKLIFVFKNGDEIETQWEYPSRSEGWTEEMREKARLKTLAYNGGVING